MNDHLLFTYMLHEHSGWLQLSLERLSTTPDGRPDLRAMLVPNHNVDDALYIKLGPRETYL